jgi:hypothetical protein
MKTPITIAIVASALQLIASFYYLLLNLKILKYSEASKGINDIMQVFFFLSGVGLLIFFIMFYDKESRK